MSKKNHKNTLDTILASRKADIEIMYSQFGIQYFETLVEQHIVLNKEKKFSKALQKNPLSLIAEFKKQSPSKGLIYAQFSLETLHSRFMHHASAFSVLTEPKFFLGRPEYIPLLRKKTSKPLLRKDFIFDAIQVIESKLLGAHAILLIVKCLSPAQLQSLVQLAHSLGLEALVEVHNQEEMDIAFSIDAIEIIGINNRDLTTFAVDLNTSITLSQYAQEQKFKGVLISESGYTQAQQCATLRDHGISGVLIGEGLSKHDKLLHYFKS